MRQDQLIFGALMGTLSTPVLPLVSRTTTTREAWTILASTYNNPSRSHILQLRQNLNNITKTTQTITDYMNTIKTSADHLALMGKPLDHEDIIDKVLKGLNSDIYQSFIMTVNARDTPITFEELTEKLLHHELNLASAQPAPAFPASVHAAAFRGRAPPSPALLPTPPGHAATTSRKPFLGKCQFCRAVGHVASDCFSFKRAYPMVVFPAYQRPRAPQAHVATVGTASTGWLLDSGATHHVTHDLSNLQTHAPYDGSEELIIGDGTTLPITHVGKFSISVNSRTFHFDNVLVVPSISRNILSISQFCQTNNTTIEFSPHNFCVKALQTGLPLLLGPTKDDVYDWRPPAVFATATMTLHHWHHRLGNPSSRVMQFIKNIASISVPSTHFQCNSCDVNKSHKLPFQLSTITSHYPLDIVYSDVWTSPLYSFDGFKYYIIFVDHFTKYMWLYPMKHKSDTSSIFPRFQALVEKYFSCQIRTLYSDNGGEFIKLALTLSQSGISHLTTPPHTPEHNDYSERRHRHLVETGLSL